MGFLTIDITWVFLGLNFIFESNILVLQILYEVSFKTSVSGELLASYIAKNYNSRGASRSQFISDRQFINSGWGGVCLDNFS